MLFNGVIDGVALFETLYVYPFTTKISIVNLTEIGARLCSNTIYK